MYNLNKNSSEEEILSFSYEQFEKMSVSELNKKISKTKNECDGVNRQNICEHIFFLLKGCNYEKLTIALPIVVLLIMGLAYLFIFNTTERKIYRSLDIDIPFSELTIKEMHNGYGDDFKGDGESLHLITSKQDLKKATQTWEKLPQKEILIYLFGEVGDSMAELISLPNVKKGKYKFISRGSNKETYNFTLYIYDENNNKIYCINIDT